MNMKKTIAAIAAGAMAVSAMASSVSALELKDQVLSYNLVRTYKKIQKGTVTLTATFRNVDFPTNDLIIGVDAVEAASLGLKVKTLTLTGKYVDGSSSIGSDTETIVPYTRSSDEGGENYDPTVKDGYMVVNAATAPEYLTDPSGSAAMNITITAVCEHEVDRLLDINNAIVAHKLAVWYADSTLGDYKANQIVDDTISIDAYNALPATDTATGSNNIIDKTDYDTYDVNGNTPPVSDATYAVLKTAGTTLTGTHIELKNGTTAASAFTAKSEVKYKAPFETKSDDNLNIVWYLENANVRDDSGDTFAGADKTKWGGYTNVLPLINDAIANYGTVTFTFHTATQGIAWTVQNSTTGEELFDHIYGRRGGWADNADYQSRRYEDALEAYNLHANWGGTRELLAFYDDGWYADTSYTKFTQHLYNGTEGWYGASDYGTWTGFAGGEEYYGGLWGDNNLFGGALVINENRSFAPK